MRRSARFSVVPELLCFHACIPNIRRGAKHMITSLENGVKPIQENLLGDLQRLLVNLNNVRARSFLLCKRYSLAPAHCLASWLLLLQSSCWYMDSACHLLMELCFSSWWWTKCNCKIPLLFGGCIILSLLNFHLICFHVHQTLNLQRISHSPSPKPELQRTRKNYTPLVVTLLSPIPVPRPHDPLPTHLIHLPSSSVSLLLCPP